MRRIVEGVLRQPLILVERSCAIAIHSAISRNPQFPEQVHDPPPRPQTLDMRARHELPLALIQLAEAQAGVVSREQVHLVGVSDA
jgi:hypothetical protein